MNAGHATTRILVVIPTLGNRLDTLRESLASVKTQSTKADIVIVGPRSCDALLEIGHSFGATVIDDPGRLAEAINLGVREALADHDFVTWLNDDDILTRNSLESTAHALEHSPSAVAAFGYCDYVSESGNFLGRSRLGSLATVLMRFGPDLVPQPGLLIRSDAWQKLNGLDTKYELAFDLDLLLRLRTLGKVICVNKVVSRFRWHAQSLTVLNRTQNLSESRRARIAALPITVRAIAWLWEVPTAITMKVAARLLNYRLNRATRSR